MARPPLLTTRYAVTVWRPVDGGTFRAAGRFAGVRFAVLGRATFLTAFFAALAVGRLFLASVRPALFLAVLARDFLAMAHSPMDG